MADYLDGLDKLPEISFIDDMTLEDVQNLLINSFKSNYKELTGKDITLARADPNRLILLSCAELIYQGLENVDKAGKMNFLKYSYGDYLKNMAALKGVAAQEPQPATVMTVWKLEEPRESATAIPAGSRLTASYEAYFESTEYAEIPAGETEVEVVMTCTEAGTVGNDFAPGEINEMVDPIAFIAEAYNISTSEGGTDEESDESLAERTYLAPSSYSTAGPDDAYVYWALQYADNIGDVLVTSPTPGVVDVRFILDDGSLPSDEMVAGMTEHLSQAGKRPLTDYVQVAAPDTQTYNIDITYYINTSDSDIAATIQEEASEAVQEYIEWQGTSIGRDIVPDQLITYLKQAGAKRVEINEPAFTVLPDTTLAVLGTSKVTYGGLEDD